MASIADVLVGINPFCSRNKNKEKEAMKCNCDQKVNAKLKDQNLELVGYTYLMPDFVKVPVIKTDWIERNKAPKSKKNSPPGMIASYCPFCGMKI